MATLSEQITEDIKSAMRAKDTVTLGTLRALKSALKNSAIEKGGADAVLDDSEVTAVIRKQIKQRQDSITQFEQAGRTELAEKEKSEIAVLEGYLPAALTQEEIDQAVAEAIAETGATSRAEMGKVMKVLQEKTEGRADGKTLSQAVQNKLA
ncbi:GatB/YqeY domain-containing protein [Roseibacillus ishigakijimensis]|uniref:GatB/YqeY domain-containing protein n=1 Tax=Roseibacillus ishigakijimensis TaxID=454146 RepID=A0A934RVW6_9BACT|nr:GatB/YqeY domain-containing protein [Roseibacillus ishigakijimensis]MBK1835125.1 GatB/YqeY domain-containing protein [Roseibacillus ishigakijimensis]